MHRSRTPRLVRGAAAATIATFTALLSHVTGGGAMPTWIGVAIPWVLAVMVCTVLAGRTLAVWRLGAAVAISQLLFHTLFVIGLPSSAATTAGVVHDHAAMAGALGHAAGASHTHTSMWAAHVLAAIVTLAVLHRGESTARRLLALARDMVAAFRRKLRLSVTASTAPPAAPIVHVQRVVLPLGWRPSSVARRGPPRLRTA